MRYLLLVAHGSRRDASNAEVRGVAMRLGSLKSGFDEVGAAFLELADPLIPEGIVAAIEKGATEVVVLPYFLSAGRHVTKDIPAEVNFVREQYPQIDIKIAPYLGSSPKLPEILAELAV